MNPEKSDQSDNRVLWMFATLAVALIALLFIADLPAGWLRGEAPRPVPGKVYHLTAENIAAAKRHAPVLLALFTTAGNSDGSRMSRGLVNMADRVKNRAIVAMGDLDKEPDLEAKANVRELPVWIVYRDGAEVGRATGANADIGLEKLITDYTGEAP